MTPRLAAVAFAAAAAALLLACNGVCPSGTDPRADPEGLECGTREECRVRCACAVSEDDEIEIIVGDCQGGFCRGAEELCEDACGDMDLVAYCRAPN